MALTSGNVKALSANADTDDELEVGILDKIRRYTYDLSRTNCPDVVYDYFNKKTNGNLDSANKKVTELMDIGEWMLKLSDFVREKTGGDSGDLIDTLCLTINGIYKQIIDFIEEVLTLVPDLFRKIDQLRREIESVLLNFAIEIKNCIIDVINAVQNKINSLFTSVLDFNAIQRLMEACPCITEFFGWLFRCEDKSSSSAVIACMRDIMGLDPSGALTVINNFFNNILKATIQSVYAALEAAVRYIFKLLMTPLREIVKFYCEMLNYKIDVSVIVSVLGGFDCILLYTKESKVISNKPVSYKGMSVIDIVNTLKMWASCFDTVCSFSDDIRLEIKRFNEELRLTPAFWKDPYTIDIFQSCMAPSLGLGTDDVATREVFVVNQDKTKNTLVDLFDAVKKGRKQNIIVYSPYNDLGATEAMVMKPEPESATGSDTGNLSATKVFYDGIEDKLIKLISNISDGMPEEDYLRILTSLRSWAYQYKKNPQLIDAINKAEYEYSRKSNLGSNVGEVSVTTAYVGDFNDVKPLNLDLEPTYKLDENNSYVTFNIRPERDKNMSLSDYYAKWYSVNV